MREPRTGILLINLGSPESPEPRDVRRYLREFLSDPRVLDGPAALRAGLLYGVILPFRPRRSAKAYRQIWTPEGSPLLVHSEALRRALAEELGPAYVVELAMRYATPSIRSALARLHGADVARIVALPLFPQYSEAATGSAVARLDEEFEREPDLPPHDVLPPFYENPGFVAAWAAVAGPELERFRPDHVLFSYHGLPERQLRAADPTGGHCLARPDCCDAVGEANRRCYRAHCHATTRALARALGLASGSHSLAFQSRLGPAAWIRPYTDQVVNELAAGGRRRLAVLCPAFVADCLETLEEIGIRLRASWRELGGEDFLLVPSLNAHPRWVEAVAGWIRAWA